MCVSGCLIPSQCRQRKKLGLWQKAISPEATHERWWHAGLAQAQVFTVEMTNDLLIPLVLGLLLSTGTLSLFGSIDLIV